MAGWNGENEKGKKEGRTGLRKVVRHMYQWESISIVYVGVLRRFERWEGVGERVSELVAEQEKSKRRKKVSTDGKVGIGEEFEEAMGGRDFLLPKEL